MLVEFLEGFLVIASVAGVIYAPFHFLDSFASPEAKSKAIKAIKAGQLVGSTKPLESLLDRIFGRRHLSLRSLALSSITSLVFTFLFLGVANTYLLNFADYLEERKERTAEVEEKIQQAVEALIPLNDALIEAMEGADGYEQKIEELRERRRDLEEMRSWSPLHGSQLLLWMVLSIAISMNLLCDYLSLGETRLILRQISKSDSNYRVLGLLFVDLLLTLMIWIASVSVFLIINRETFLTWGDETPALVAVVGVISLATTLSTSLWLYAFLAGSFVTTVWQGMVRVILKKATFILNPYLHTFKVIGILGSTVVLGLLTLALLLAKLR